MRTDHRADPVDFRGAVRGESVRVTAPPHRFSNDPSVLRVVHLRSLWRLMRRGLRLLGRLAVVAAIAFALLVLALRYLVLPRIDGFRDSVEAAVTRSLGQPVTIGRMEGHWSGLHPRLTLTDVTVHDAQKRPALRLSSVDAVLGWRSVLVGAVRLKSLVIERPDLVVRQDRAGQIFVAGIPVRTDGPDSGVGDWVLAQALIQIRDARLVWIDEQRGAPPLVLTDVVLQLENRRAQHRFALRARPSSEVGTLIDARGDFRARRASGLATARGRVYLSTPYFNLGAIRQWVDLPVTLESGAGAVEGWLEFANGGAQSATLDVRVAGAVARFDPEIEPLDLPAVQGRLTWLRTPDGFEASARRLTIGMATGAVLPPADVVVRRRTAAPGRTARWQVESDRVDIAPLMYVAGRMPLPPPLREALQRHAPAGRVALFALTVEPGADGHQRYEVATRFEKLSIVGGDGIPGVSGISGSIRADQASGQVELDSAAVVINAPGVFAAPLRFDALRGLLEWRMDGGRPNFRLHRLAFENTDLSGGAQGTLRFDPALGGVIDLQGGIVRASVPAVPGYLPVLLGEATTGWLRGALVAGAVRDATVRVAGPLRAFPFPKGVEGRFEVRVPVSGVELRYGDDWPTLTNVAGTVALDGAAMRVDATADTSGARVTSAVVRIDDLAASDAVLEVKGEAQGPAPAFLQFIEKSPLGEMIGQIQRGVTMDGAGRLRLALAVPITHGRDTRVSGNYQFQGNQVEGLVGLPPLGRVTGSLDFTERGARMPAATAEFLGMPVRFGVDVKADGAVVVDARGRARIDRLREQFPHPLAVRVTGEADWRALASVKGDRGEVTVDSDLRGVATDFPKPLGKAAPDAVVARYQRRWRDGNLFQTLTVADRVAVSTAGSEGDAPGAFRRAGIDIGGGTPRLPDRPGVLVTGGLPRFDVDPWLALIDSLPPAPAGKPAETVPIAVATDIQFGTLSILEREFHEVTLRLQRRGTGTLWDGTVASREVKGRLDWLPANRGRLVARLERLHLPDAAPSAAVTPGEAMTGHDLPGLDITADSFRFGTLDLGALVLRAMPEGRNWEIEKLALSSPDGRLEAQGGWTSVRGRPRTNLDFRIEASDIGKVLKRFNRPEGVSGGTATLWGSVEWDGSPQRPDLPSLSGRISLEAKRGRFTQLDPGIGKLFGILSLQALPRRVTLDFRDVFSQGFVFDEITGEGAIQTGVLHTDNLRMLGSSASVLMKGDIDLAREKQNLEVTIVPSITDSLAIGAAIVNPVAGLAALLLGKALNNPIDRIIAFEYRVTGTWTDPVVSKGNRPAPQTPPARR